MFRRGILNICNNIKDWEMTVIFKNFSRLWKVLLYQNFVFVILNLYFKSLRRILKCNGTFMCRSNLNMIKKTFSNERKVRLLLEEFLYILNNKVTQKIYQNSSHEFKENFSFTIEKVLKYVNFSKTCLMVLLLQFYIFLQLQ